MEKNAIIEKECQNDGSRIHLYYNKNIGAWCGFGYSAYGLRLFDKSNGFMNMRSFSEDLQLPCTVTEARAITALINYALEIREQTENSLTLVMPEAFSIEAYNKWEKKLRASDSDNSNDDDVVPEGIKDAVEKNVFIPDHMSAFERNTKRMVDCFLSGVALLIFSPVCAVCAIAIRREDKGPAIFKQERIGRFGRPFNIYKFRTMRMDAEKMGPQLSHGGGDNDPRLTKVGKFLRAHHLDEIPQLYNIFKGDMAFIGPRPERKFYIDQILEYDNRYTYLYQIRPGATSYATLYNGYTDTMAKMLRRLEYDLYYLAHRSWWFDFKILANTFFSIVFGKKF